MRIANLVRTERGSKVWFRATVDMYMFDCHDVHVSEGKKVRWTIASARQNLPTVVGLAAREPQDIYRRDTLVARVVSPESDQPPRARPTPAEIFTEMQRICAEDNYTLEVPQRRDRPNPFAPARAKAARKRKRKA